MGVYKLLGYYACIDFLLLYVITALDIYLTTKLHMRQEDEGMVAKRAKR